MPQVTHKHILDKVESLCRLIRGDPDDHEDMGLIGDVHDNTKFRKHATKFTWVLIVAVLALWGNLIAQIIVNNGGK